MRPTWAALFAAVIVGHWRARPGPALLCLLGVAVGTAVTVSVELAVRSSTDSFAATVDALAGASTHRIVGGPEGLPEELFVELLRAGDAEPKTALPLSPILDRAVLVSRSETELPEPTGSAEPAEPTGSAQPTEPTDASARPLSVRARLLGVDPFADRDFRRFSDVATTLGGDDLSRFLTEPGTAVIVEPLAVRLGLSVGDRVWLKLGGLRRPLLILGTFRLEGPSAVLLDDLIVTDIATAQETLDAVGRLDRIDLAVPADASGPQRLAVLGERLRRLAPDSVRLTDADEQNRTLDKLTAAYRLNLHAMALMAALVAVFAVYNTLLVTVAGRRSQLGVLRCLGATPTLLGSLLLAEAVAFGLLGGALGVGLGWALSAALTTLVSDTIGQFYAVVRPVPTPPDLATLAQGLTVGVVSALLGAAVPLIQAVRVEPILAARRSESLASSADTADRLAVLGLAVLAVGTLGMFWPAPTVMAGFAGAVALILGAAAAVGSLTRVWAAGVAALAATLTGLPGMRTLGPILRLGAASMQANVGTSATAVAALMAALTMSVALGTMVAGFRTAVVNWLDRRYQADVFVTHVASAQQHIETPLSPEAVARLSAVPEATRVTYLRQTDLTVGDEPFQLVATDVAGLLREEALDLRGRAPGELSEQLREGVFLSLPAADRLGVGPGDRVSLPLGPRSASLTVLGVYNDFTTDRGQVLLDLATYRALTGDRSVNSVYLHVGDGSPEAAARVRDRLRSDPTAADLSVVAYADVRREALAIFDRTFAVTDVLTGLAYLTAFAGLTGALSALAVRRLRQYAVLRLLGMGSGQTVALLAVEAVLPALLAAGLSLLVGTAMAAVLAWVIQYRSFGWSIPLSAQPTIWAQTVVLAVSAALPAIIWPSWRLLRADPAAALREE